MIRSRFLEIASSNMESVDDGNEVVQEEQEKYCQELLRKNSI